MKSSQELGKKERKESSKKTSQQSMQEKKEGSRETCVQGKWQRTR